MNDPTHRPNMARPITVTVCRGCCCGNPARHPHTDHDGQLVHLAAAAEAARARLHTSRCLGLCSHSNVVRVRTPDTHGETHTHWYGNLHDNEHIRQLADWIRVGAPQPAPAGIAHLQIGASPPAVRNSQAAGPTTRSPDSAGRTFC